MASAVRVWVPLKTRCSMRWDMPARPSGSCREPVSTHTPTATDRTCSIRSVTTRMPLGGTLFRYPSLTGTAFSGARRIRRLWVLELFLVGERRLLAQRHLAGEPHLAVAVDLDDLDEDLVTLGQHVLDRANPVLGDLRDVQEPLGVGDDLHERAELDDLLDLTEVDPVEFGAFVEVIPNTEGLLHISQIAENRIRSVQDVLTEGDEVLVKVIEIDGNGKMRLSRKMALRDQPALADKEKLKNPQAANPPRA